MKHLKKSLAVLLALIMALGLGLPAMAEDDYWWKGIEVIVHPQGNEGRETIIKSGESFTVEAELRGTENLPEGWRVTYYWSVEVMAGDYYNSYTTTTATEPILHVSPGDEAYPRTMFTGGLDAVAVSFQCEARIVLPSGESWSSSWTEEIYIVILRSFFEKLPDLLSLLGQGAVAILFIQPLYYLTNPLALFKLILELLTMPIWLPFLILIS